MNVRLIIDMGRSMIALFIIAFVAIFVAFWTGVVGCWKRSPGNITATAILMLLACEYTHFNIRMYIPITVCIGSYYRSAHMLIRSFECRIVGLLSAGGMGLWHGVEYYEKEKIIGEEYFQQWSNVSVQQQQNQRIFRAATRFFNLVDVSKAPTMIVLNIFFIRFEK